MNCAQFTSIVEEKIPLKGSFSGTDSHSCMSTEKARTKKPSKKRDTLTRKDVMQKTIFRALRKEYEYFFNKFLQWKNYSLNYDLSQFKVYLRDFVDYMLGWESNQSLTAQYGEFENLPFIVGLMVDF